MPSYSRRVMIPGKTSEQLYKTVSETIEPFLNKAQLGKCEIDRDPEDKILQIKHKLFSAKLSCDDAQMELDVQLSFLAAPFKSKLDESITHWLAKTFNI